MSTGLRACPDCGRSYVARPGMRKCLACLYQSGEDTKSAQPELEPLSYTPDSDDAQPSSPVLRGLQGVLDEAKALSDALRKGTGCIKCDSPKRLPDSKLCLGCQLELYNSLGVAASDLRSGPSPKPEKTVSRMLVLETMRQKRRRTGYRNIETPSIKRGAV